MAIEIPPNTPYMAHALVTADIHEDYDPTLCPCCLHATVCRVTVTVLHDNGVVALPTDTLCASDECFEHDDC